MTKSRHHNDILPTDEEIGDPAGEIRLGLRNRIGARVTVLAGLALVASTIVIDPGNTDTSKVIGLG